MTRATIALLLIGTVPPASGCDVFDASLYLDADGGGGDSGPGSTDGATDGGADAGGATGFALADRCLGDVPNVSPSPDFIPLETVTLADDFRSVATCTGFDAPGNDGFFSITASAGEKWHFHLRGLDASRNPSIYILRGTCDERTCQRGDATDFCATQDEHISFVAPADGTYFVGVDDRNPDGGPYEVLATLPTCGNGGTPEHSEACEDGNTMSGDGCDDRCRAELAPGRETEMEPNDDVPGANVLPFDGTPGTFTVQADIGSACDQAVYAVQVPAGASIQATTLSREGTACGAGSPEIELVLIGTDGSTIAGAGTVRAGNDCPVIDATDAFAQGLAAGEYFLRIRSDAITRPFDYRLQVDVL